MRTFFLPDLGEGLPDAEIAVWHVKVGDEVVVDQPLVSMETAKALVEVPSPYAGKILKLLGNPGEKIKTGSVLVEFEGDAGTVAGRLETSEEIISPPAIMLNEHREHHAKATPAVRALAKRLQIDLSTVIPSHENGILTSQDVEQAASVLGKAGPLEQLKGMRRTMAEAMSHSHAEVVPVTLMDDVALDNIKSKKEITVSVIQAIVKSCQAEPALNAWFDGNQLARRLMPEINLGIAVDSALGLLVPVIHQVQLLSASECRQKLDNIKLAVDHRSITPKELQGATIALSNFGKYAGRYATPIVVPPLVAIVGIGQLREEVVPLEGKPVICSVLPLMITFDHRAVTGGEAARFLKVLKQTLQEILGKNEST